MKGNTGVVKSVIAELTDETNVARGFSLLPMTWALGYVIGLGLLAYGARRLLMSQGSLAHSSVASYRDHKTAGHTSSHILSGLTTRTSCHV